MYRQPSIQPTAEEVERAARQRAQQAAAIEARYRADMVARQVEADVDRELAKLAAEAQRTHNPDLCSPAVQAEVRRAALARYMAGTVAPQSDATPEARQALRALIRGAL